MRCCWQEKVALKHQIRLLQVRGSYSYGSKLDPKEMGLATESEWSNVSK